MCTCMSMHVYMHEHAWYKGFTIATIVVSIIASLISTVPKASEKKLPSSFLEEKYLLSHSKDPCVSMPVIDLEWWTMGEKICVHKEITTFYLFQCQDFLWIISGSFIRCYFYHAGRMIVFCNICNILQLKMISLHALWNLNSRQYKHTNEFKKLWLWQTQVSYIERNRNVLLFVLIYI